MPSRTKTAFCLLALIGSIPALDLRAQEAAKPEWTFPAGQLRPFWLGGVMEGESVLFIKDEKTDEARASVLFPIRKLLSVRDSTGEVQYEEGRDYVQSTGRLHLKSNAV